MNMNLTNHGKFFLGLFLGMILVVVAVVFAVQNVTLLQSNADINDDPCGGYYPMAGCDNYDGGDGFIIEGDPGVFYGEDIEEDPAGDESNPDLEACLEECDADQSRRLDECNRKPLYDPTRFFCKRANNSMIEWEACVADCYDTF